MRLLALMLCISGALGIALIAAPQPPNDRERSLTPIEEAVVRAPFVSQEVEARLRADLEPLEKAPRVRDLLPSGDQTRPAGARVMGWAQPDEVYWRNIPLAARTIPTDWEHLPAVHFANTQLGGIREIRLAVGPVYDQWLLSDPRHDLTACISIERAHRRIYFMEIARGKDGQWEYHEAFDRCYSCHPSGPRVIRTFDEARVDKETLARFNRKLLAYGACDFGDTVDTDQRGAPISDAQCTGCHDGVIRGKLYAIHDRTIRFKTLHDGTMPPPLPLPRTFRGSRAGCGRRNGRVAPGDGNS